MELRSRYDIAMLHFSQRQDGKGLGQLWALWGTLKESLIRDKQGEKSVSGMAVKVLRKIASRIQDKTTFQVNLLFSYGLVYCAVHLLLSLTLFVLNLV